MMRFIVFFVLLGSQTLFAAQLYRMTTDVWQGKIRLSFVMNQITPVRMFVLPNPYRLVMDFEATKPDAHWNKAIFPKGLIQRMRAGQPKPQVLRLVFETGQALTFTRSAWQARSASEKSFTVILSPAAGMLTKKNPGIPLPVHSNKQKPVLVRHAPAMSLRDVVVVIDPGHGGHDPGASGPNRCLEKHVTLAIARTLKQRIDKEPGMRAILTRNADYYVGLRQRLHLARVYRGDLFVSIHADAFIHSESNGASVFALSQRGATSEAARWLAEKENYSELGGVNLKDLDDDNGLVRSVLLDLSQTATIRSSVQMGNQVLRQLSQITRLHNSHVDQARFMVLKSPDIPSVLVETGFISNPREARNLTDKRYQMRLAQAIFQGIQGYFSQYPPQGSRLEATASAMRRHAAVS